MEAQTYLFIVLSIIAIAFLIYLYRIANIYLDNNKVFRTAVFMLLFIFVISTTGAFMYNRHREEIIRHEYFILSELSMDYYGLSKSLESFQINLDNTEANTDAELDKLDRAIGYLTDMVTQYSHLFGETSPYFQYLITLNDIIYQYKYNNGIISNENRQVLNEVIIKSSEVSSALISEKQQTDFIMHKRVKAMKEIIK